MALIRMPFCSFIDSQDLIEVRILRTVKARFVSLEKVVLSPHVFQDTNPKSLPWNKFKLPPISSSHVFTFESLCPSFMDLCVACPHFVFPTWSKHPSWCCKNTCTETCVPGALSHTSLHVEFVCWGTDWGCCKKDLVLHTDKKRQ